MSDAVEGQYLAGPGESGPRVGYEIGSAFVSISEWRPGEPFEFVPYLAGDDDTTVIPETFGALFEDGARLPGDVRLVIRIGEQGEPICSSLTLFRGRTQRSIVQTERMLEPAHLVEREAGRISNQSLREIPVASLIRTAILAALHERRPDGSIVPLELDTWEQLYRKSTQLAVTGRRALDDNHYREVARVYRAAMNSAAGSGDAKPTDAVKKHFHTSWSTAARWIRTARDKDFLGPAMQRRPGEGPMRKTKRGKR